MEIKEIKENKEIKEIRETVKQERISEPEPVAEQQSVTASAEYISSESEPHSASGLYSVSRKSDGGLEIKFDDIKLENKRNTLKQEIVRLKNSNSSEDKKKIDALKRKLSDVEKKIREQKS